MARAEVAPAGARRRAIGADRSGAPRLREKNETAAAHERYAHPGSRNRSLVRGTRPAPRLNSRRSFAPLALAGDHDALSAPRAQSSDTPLLRPARAVSARCACTSHPRCAPALSNPMADSALRHARHEPARTLAPACSADARGIRPSCSQAKAGTGAPGPTYIGVSTSAGPLSTLPSLSRRRAGALSLRMRRCATAPDPDCTRRH